MKVLMAQKYWFRGDGVASVVYGLTEGLEARGHEVIPFSVAYERTESSPWSKYFVSPLAGDDAAFLNEMRLDPITMVRLLGRATYSTEAYRKALTLVDDAKPDIAYAHNIYSYMSPSILRAFRKRGIPIALCVHDYFMLCAELHLLRDGRPCTECLTHGFKRALRYNCCKGSFLATSARVASMYVHKWLKLYDLVDVFVTPSLCMKQALVEAGYDEDRIAHLPNFVDVPERTDQDEEDYILYFGRVSEEKGIGTLIEAFDCLPERDGLRLVIAGRGCEQETEKLQRLCRSLDLQGVEFVGHQGPVELRKLLGRCLFTVLPSVWHENFPMSVLESFARGKPVIGSDIGGIPEQITPDCGFLVEPGSTHDLADKMQTLLGDSALRHRMGNAAHARVQELFSLDAHCDRLVDLFEGLIEKSAGARTAEGVAPPACAT